MITVAGLNTAVDRLIEVDSLEVGEVHRARNARALPGGKGIHVALTCAALGEPVRLVGFIDPSHRAGFTEFLTRRGVECAWVEIEDEIRSCLAIADRSGRTTEVLEPGPEVGEAEGAAVCSRLVASSLAVRPGDVTVLAGSLPRGMPESTYAELIQTLKSKSRRCLLDTSGAALRAGVAARPFGVKPNWEEARALLGKVGMWRKEMARQEDATTVARQLNERGVSLAVVSLGEDGAVASWDGAVCTIQVPVQQALNAVGAGDCMLGGVAVGLARELSRDKVLRLGAACGVAKTLTRETGMLKSEDVDRLLSKIRLDWAR
ncbi:MAG: 1-phosphofructokinase family hexose kinase [Acidobacteriota bacterium]